MLSTMAFYNRYPFVYPDTGGYLLLENSKVRSLFYSYFVYPARLTHRLWPVVLVQSLMVAYLLRLFLREVFGIVSRREFIIVIAAMCLLTSLPWYTGFLMPDIFTPVLALCLFMMAFCLKRLGRAEQCYVIALGLVAATMHYSHIPIALGLLSCALAARLILRRRAPGRAPRLLWPASVTTVAIGAIVLSNYLTVGLLTLAPAGSAFELARLVADGQAVEYLRENCGHRNYKLCVYLDQMPMSTTDFLWSSIGPFKTLGRMGLRNEGEEIIKRTIEEFPLWTLGSAVWNTYRQLLCVHTGTYLSREALGPFPTDNIKAVYPNDFSAYLNSKQNQGELSRLRRLDSLHMIAIVTSVIICVLIAIVAASRRRWLPVELLITVATAILLNAFVSGAVSEPQDRYGSRVIWMLPLVAIASWRQLQTLLRGAFRN